MARKAVLRLVQGVLRQLYSGGQHHRPALFPTRSIPGVCATSHRPIQLPYNSIVRGYINRYTDSRYGTISRILGMSQYYFPLIEDELLKEGLPIELRALPIIESALSVTAVSPMGAVGLWQFMPSTGKSYGLEVNSLVDERRDPLPRRRRPPAAT